MTPEEHAKVWRRAARKIQVLRYSEGHIAWLILDAVAAAYEQSAKEQEGPKKVEP